MLGDFAAPADPDPVVAQDVIDETGKRGGARRLASETAMHSDGHHLGRLLALAVERVEIVAQRDEEILGLTPAQATREARVVVVERSQAFRISRVVPMACHLPDEDARSQS